MGTMQIRKIVTGLVTTLLAFGASAQGFVNFSEIPGVDDEPIVEVNITPIAIAIVRGMIGATDPQTAELLSKLRGIQVRAYDTSSNSRQINNFIDNITKELEGDGWERVVTVQDEGARVRVLLQMTEQAVSGMTVMVMDDSEAFFINVDATVTTEDLGQIMAAFKLQDMLGPMLTGVAAAGPAAGSVD
jgi:hypothetical protein